MAKKKAKTISKEVVAPELKSEAKAIVEVPKKEVKQAVSSKEKTALRKKQLKKFDKFK